MHAILMHGSQKGICVSISLLHSQNQAHSEYIRIEWKEEDEKVSGPTKEGGAKRAIVLPASQPKQD